MRYSWHESGHQVGQGHACAECAEYEHGLGGRECHGQAERGTHEWRSARRRDCHGQDAREEGVGYRVPCLQSGDAGGQELPELEHTRKVEAKYREERCQCRDKCWRLQLKSPT